MPYVWVDSMKPSKTSQRIQIVLAIVIVCFLAFVGGAFVAEFKVFPYPQIFADAFAYMHASEERTETEEEAQVEQEKVKPKGRVSVAATSEAFDGYTFLTFDVGRPYTAWLIDMQGNVVHEWRKPLRQIWSTPPHRDKPSPDNAIAFRYAELFPNGDMITVLKASGDTPDGYGLVKLDKDSNLIWAAADNFHHHFSIASDGRIFGTTHQWRDTQARPVAGAPYLSKKVLEDFVVELSPEGKELSRVSLLDAIAAPEFQTLLGSSLFRDHGAKSWDRLHPNDVEIIEADFAAHHAFMKPGMVMISLRDLDALIVVDMTSGKMVWATRGAWVRQHDPDLLPNGNVLLFDNRGDDVKPSGSRILELNPSSGKIVWSYAGNPKRKFRSDKAGGQELLPNGNVLISEDDNGRVFEVTREGKIVWEYRDARLHQATRVSKDWLKFTPSKRGASAMAAGDDRSAK
jgi:outer membrane protein assembly factor BamB